jgi:hypothetical protein
MSISGKMRTMLCVLAAGGVILSGQVYAEDEIVDSGKWGKKHVVDIGTGLGLDYGGIIGIKAAFMPVPWVSLFGAGGFYLIGPGWQAGAAVNILPKTTKYVYRPVFKFMFGTNSAIRFTVINGSGDIEKIYIGPTIGLGNEFRFGSTKKHGFDVDLNIPIRSQAFKDDIKYIEDLLARPDVSGELPSVSPVALSFGYHFEF